MKLAAWFCSLLISTSAWAEWLFVGASAQADFYIETSSILREGSHRQVLELLNLKQVDPQGNRSYVALYEYDCEGGRARILRSACFDGAMGGGRKTSECHVPGNWSQPGEASAGLVKLKMVCGP